MQEHMRKAFILFFLGLIGVLSLWFSELPMDNIPKDILNQFTKTQFKLLIMVNPIILLVAGVLLGSFLGPKVHLGAPLIESFIHKTDKMHILKTQLKYGALLGGIGSLTVVALAYLLEPLLPKALIESQNIELHPLTRFLYGGFTEELQMRYGFMTLFVFLPYIIFKPDLGSKKWPYIIGILLSTFLFGMGHLPVAYQLIGYLDFITVTYILVGNGLIGLLAGWLFWKKGIEAAFIAHIAAHVVLLIFGS